MSIDINEIRRMAGEDWDRCYMGLRDAIATSPKSKIGPLDAEYVETFNTLQTEYRLKTYGH